MDVRVVSSILLKWYIRSASSSLLRASGAKLRTVGGVEPSALLHYVYGTAFLTIRGQHRPQALLITRPKNLFMQRGFCTLS